MSMRQHFEPSKTRVHFGLPNGTGSSQVFSSRVPHLPDYCFQTSAKPAPEYLPNAKKEYAQMIEKKAEAAKEIYLRGIAIVDAGREPDAYAEFRKEEDVLQAAKRIYRRAVEAGSGESAARALTRFYEDIIELHLKYEYPESVLPLYASARNMGMVSEKLRDCMRAHCGVLNERIAYYLEIGDKPYAHQIIGDARALGLPAGIM
jgi:hypothetical protein